MRRRVALLFPPVLIFLALGYLTLWPLPIRPVGWAAPVDTGFTGAFAKNARLDELERMPLGAMAHGPEDAAVGPDGRIYASTRGGSIVVVEPESGAVEAFAETGGQPLGIEFGPDGRLYVADAYRGLLVVDTAGDIVELANLDDVGQRLEYVDDLDVGADGAVFFSDASSKFGARAWGGTLAASLLDIMEHGGHGRVFRYDPESGSVSVVLSGLNFANGVALAEDGRFVLVNETGSYRVLKHWLTGPRAGRTDVLLANLPGFPDNLNRSADGTFWLGLISLRSPALDALSNKPFLRKIVQRLPAVLRPKARSYGCVVHFDEEGNVLETWQSPAGRYAMTTGAADGPGGTTLITSLTEPDLGLLHR